MHIQERNWLNHSRKALKVYNYKARSTIKKTLAGKSNERNFSVSNISGKENNQAETTKKQPVSLLLWVILLAFLNNATSNVEDLKQNGRKNFLQDFK